MPTFINPKFVHVETGGSGGGLVAAGVAVVAVGAAAVWVVREVLAMWVELAIIIGGTAAIIGSWLVWMAIKYNGGRLPVNEAALAEIRADRARAALPAGDVHYHTHYEEHHHLHQADQHVHVHRQEQQAPVAVEAATERPAIAPRAPVLGSVLSRRDERTRR